MKKILLFLFAFFAGMLQAGQDINQKTENQIIKCCIALKMPIYHVLSSNHYLTDEKIREMYGSYSPKYCERFLELRKTAEFKKLQNDLCLANEKASSMSSNFNR
jgi:hypothetical protein